MIKAILSVVVLTTLTAFSTLANEFKVDTKASTIKWTAEKVTGGHWGHIDLKSGKLILKDGKLADGEFVTDMTTIAVKDLEPGEYNTKLLNHLKSDDFFSVAKHKEAKYDIRVIKDLGNNKIKVTGDLTIKGIKKQVTFTADYKIENNQIIANAEMIVDRSKFDIRYGSGSFFDNLGDKTIYDEFTLNIKLVANKI